MYAIGIDIGSTAAKAAVLQDGVLAYTVVEPTGFSSVEASERLSARLAEAGFPTDGAASVVSTGYGRACRCPMRARR